MGGVYSLAFLNKFHFIIQYLRIVYINCSVEPQKMPNLQEMIIARHMLGMVCCVETLTAFRILCWQKRKDWLQIIDQVFTKDAYT